MPFGGSVYFDDPDVRSRFSSSGPPPIRPEGDKIVRLEAQSAVIEAGCVLLPESAPWLDDFLVEILAFPHGRHDDQVDSISQFLAWASGKRRRRELIGVAPITIDKAEPDPFW